MNIIIDLDNTLFHNRVVNDVCNKYDIPHTKYYTLQDLPQYAIDECMTMFKDPMIMNYLEPIKGVRERLDSLVSEGHTLYCVTGRNNTMKDGTIEMVERHYPMISKTYIADNFDKRDIFKQLNADVVIDDHFKFILEALECGVEYVILISNNDTTYNHYALPIMNRIHKGHTITSIVDYI